MAQAATFIVTSTADSGVGSLRQAVIDANANPGADVITFALSACPCTIAVSSTISISEALQIVGPGMDQLSISGGNSVRILQVAPQAAPLSLADLTLRDGYSSQNGGAMDSQAPVFLSRVKLTGNLAVGTGGAINSSGDLSLVDSFVEQNVSQFQGGGIYSAGSAAVVVTRTTFRGNQAQSVGGALIGDLPDISDSVFEQNTANADAGAILALSGISIVGSTFAGNSAGSDSGAVHSWGPATITGSGFLANTAGRFNGAVFANGVSVASSLFDGNVALAPTGAALTSSVDTIIVSSTFSNNRGCALSVFDTLTVSGTTFDGNAGCGAIRYNGGAQAVISDSRFRFNSSAFPGGALYNAGFPALTILRTDFEGNSSNGDGGSIFHVGGNLLLDRVRFIGNVAGQGTGVGLGGAVYVSNLAPLRAHNSLFVENRAASLEGHSISFDGAGSAELLHVTIANGGAILAGSALAVRAAMPLTLANSIVADHATALSLLFGNVVPDRILVWNSGGAAPSFMAANGASIDTTLVFVGDPRFVNAAGRDYHLGVASAAVDFSPTGRLPIDFDGDTRPQGAAHDAGYDERVRDAQLITFAPLSDRPIGAPAFTVAASASSGLPVTFSTTTPSVCSVSGTVVSLLAVGNCTVIADQAGDAFWSRAQQVLRSFVITTVNPPRLVNLSTRVQVTTGDKVLIGGFIIGGSTPKTVVVRARGPSLIPLGVPNALGNPKLDLYSGQTVISSNDEWQLAPNAAAIQASGLAPSNVFEAAIHTTLAPGPHTAIVTGVGGLTGVGIIEVFEVDHAEIPLLNISTRGLVQSGGDVMIGGFVIQGDGPLTVIVRARGPSLASQGVPGTLSDPVLQLFSGQTVIASNDDWQSAANAAAIQGAGFAPPDAREAAILITLPPGAYTAIVSGKNGASGIGIVEVFAQ